jgi:DNA-directed RNA polymerase subunit RPC12/RpoP
MKFLCIECDRQMEFEERELPGDGTFGAAFRCPACGRRIAMLANPMETQLVDALGVKIGGRTLTEEPLELVRSSVRGRDDAFEEKPEPGGRSGGRPRWSAAAEERLARVPGFVRGMVKKIYNEYALERGIGELTPEIMDQARTDLGLEGM